MDRNGIDLPPDPQAWEILDEPPCMADPVGEVDLEKAGIRTIIWATGFAFDFGWLEVDAFHADGTPFHKRGISSETGIYFLGLPELTQIVVKA